MSDGYGRRRNRRDPGHNKRGRDNGSNDAGVMGVGGVERKHGVYQDRAVKELRLEDIRDIETANQFLPGFAESLNAKFAVQPRR